jgi:hypothetical protein
MRDGNVKSIPHLVCGRGAGLAAELLSTLTSENAKRQK